jgi:hypothetical protein
MKLYCKCICDGYLEDGDIFCKEGEIYSYRVKEGYQKYPIEVHDIATERHQMDWPFFHMFFEEMNKNETFTIEDFEI